MSEFEYRKATSSEIMKLGEAFLKENGDPPHGIIPDSEFDRLFDHLGGVLAKYGKYNGEGDSGGDIDFSAYRYVDQVPVIDIVTRDDLPPSICVEAALEAVRTAHRPLAVGFDYHPDYIFVEPPNLVSTTYKQSVISGDAEQNGAG